MQHSAIDGMSSWVMLNKSIEICNKTNFKANWNKTNFVIFQTKFFAITQLTYNPWAPL